MTPVRFELTIYWSVASCFNPLSYGAKLLGEDSNLRPGPYESPELTTALPNDVLVVFDKKPELPN
jgi:hypothetical protein